MTRKTYCGNLLWQSSLTPIGSEGLEAPSLWADLSPYSAAKVTLTSYDLRRERRIVWRSNVAKVGTFTGYTRSVTLVIEPYFTITVGGMNETGKENVKRKKGEANGRK